MVFKLKPRDERFFGYFEDLAEAICTASSTLEKFSRNPVDPEGNLEMLTRIEEQGDEILSEVMKKINNSFVTPFDREDILLLARELNNVLDHIQGTMEKFVLYKAKPPENAEYIVKLIAVLYTASVAIKDCVQRLPDVRSWHNDILESCEKIRSCEHEGDFLYRTGIALLFENTINVVDIIKWKEIYEHLETTLDYCEDVSNILKGIAIKYV